ncbi:uncharacterized protein [Spinacia oleracea]|uniref:Reverse transcriptase domain-containing protein n=1 Tax=Spinacia oleracea TaxID=3562 RepID=A0ABM3RHX4_SPIOL|nr:uncharacterized protein LOC130469770 [Spinacia oleracea]
MNPLCWNFRGFGNPRAVNALRQWCVTLAPSLVFLSETKINKSAAEAQKHRLGFDCALGNHICGDSLLRDLCAEYTGPLLVSGDFNEIICYEEKEGGVDNERRAIPDFRAALEECNLRDPKLDHTPIFARLKRPKKKRRRGKKSFKFETCWLLDEACDGVAEKALKVAQGERISDEAVANCVALEKDLDDLYEKQEAFWYLRSRAADIKDGDRNTKYFHHKASQRRRRNEIKRLMDGTGQWVTEEEEIEGVVEDFYEELFTTSGPSSTAVEKVLEAVGTTISSEDNNLLLRPFTKEEIYAALCQMDPCKAPGPDGMHAIFYQKYWHIVGDDVSRYVCNILHGNCSPQPINNTNIALISKVRRPTVMSEFRPIALSNVLNKLASKAIVLRLKSILPGIISKNQSAFVPGRLVTDDALIALELFHTMKKRSKGKKGSIALKLDMSKAYDRVEWCFLVKLLLKMGFSSSWVKVVMGCVRSVEEKGIFAALKDRIWKKLQGWKEKLLSRARKEILIKSVIQAIPTYLMGVYRLPVGVIHDIQSMIAKFWWGGSGENRGVHWMNWDSMCAPKCLGGLGFRDLTIFNEALLGKQAWRLMSAPESLFGRVMRGKYYPNGEFLDSALGLSCSYSWRSIWGAKALLKEGLIWRVGNVSNINVWSDPWLTDEKGRFILSHHNDTVNYVHELMRPDTKEWDYEKITSIFEERDVRCIMAIPLSDRAPKDCLTWAYSMDDNYSVKTAYMLGKSCNFDNLHQAWIEIWKLDMTPKGVRQTVEEEGRADSCGIYWVMEGRGPKEVSTDCCYALVDLVPQK